MLQFNPNNRYRVDECLSHEFFKDIRRVGCEIVALTKIEMEIDNISNITIDMMREKFLEEIDDMRSLPNQLDLEKEPTEPIVEKDICEKEI